MSHELENPSSSGITQPGTETHESRTTCRDTPRQNPTARLSRSIRLAIYLYFCQHYNLREAQLKYVAHFQARQNLDQILRALKFAHQLTTDPRLRARMGLAEKTIEGNLVPLLNGRPVPSDQSRLKLLEQRRIGVGYRDKGSLPRRSRSWDKDNTLNEGIPTAHVLQTYDLNLLYEDPDEIETEADRGKSERRIVPQAKVLLSGGILYRLENPGPRVWRITASPLDPSEPIPAEFEFPD